MSVATLWKASLSFTIYFFFYIKVLICNQKVLQLVLKCVNKVSWAAAEQSLSCPSVQNTGKAFCNYT